MPIVSSIIVEDAPQRDGRRSVRERHMDHLGRTHDAVYLAEQGANTSTALAARTSQIEANLSMLELVDNLSRAMDQQMPRTDYSTIGQFRTQLRNVYRDARGWDVVRLGQFVWSLGLSDAQYTSVFGVSGAQLMALKSRLLAQHQRYLDVIVDEGV